VAYHGGGGTEVVLAICLLGVRPAKFMAAGHRLLPQTQLSDCVGVDSREAHILPPKSLVSLSRLIDNSLIEKISLAEL
jgi:hypothetical protein